MKHIKVFSVGLLLSISFGFTSCAPDQQNESSTKAVQKEEFDEKLATELGADDYGMKKYVMAFLKSGPNRDQDSAEVVRLQRAHMDNIKRLAEARKLVVAGPFLDDTDVRGIYIFDVETVEEAEALTNSDPAIKAGRLVMELHPWYGSAALIKTAELHKNISKSEI